MVSLIVLTKTNASHRNRIIVFGCSIGNQTIHSSSITITALQLHGSIMAIYMETPEWFLLLSVSFIFSTTVVNSECEELAKYSSGSTGIATLINRGTERRRCLWNTTHRMLCTVPDIKDSSQYHLCSTIINSELAYYYCHTVALQKIPL